jgi:hypothetical protein
LSFAPRPLGGLPAPLHAGDEVSVLPEARQPQVFRDEGAFDRRAYLALQNIDLVATLRAPELIERVRLRTDGSIGECRRAHLEDGPRWRHTCLDGWDSAGNQLLY